MSKNDFNDWMKNGKNFRTDELGSIGRDLKKEHVLHDLMDFEVIQKINENQSNS